MQTELRLQRTRQQLSRARTRWAWSCCSLSCFYRAFGSYSRLKFTRCSINIIVCGDWNQISNIRLKLSDGEVERGHSDILGKVFFSSIDLKSRYFFTLRSCNMRKLQWKSNQLWNSTHAEYLWICAASDFTFSSSFLIISRLYSHFNVLQLSRDSRETVKIYLNSKML